MSAQNNWHDQIRDFAKIVLRTNCFDDAECFLDFHNSTGGNWKPAAALLLRLMAQVKFRQAHRVSYLVDEFLPDNCPDFVVRKLRVREEQMYSRLNHVWGVRRCLLHKVASCSEGRACLRRMNGRASHE
jgi:hypothetical protein